MNRTPYRPRTITLADHYRSMEGILHAKCRAGHATTYLWCKHCISRAWANVTWKRIA